MLDTPEVLQVEEQTSAVIHLTVARADIVQVMGPAIAEILAALQAQGLKPTGPLYSYHYKRPGDVFDFEVGFPVAGAVAAAGRVQASKLPAARVVRCTYRGDYAGLGAAWGEFCAWIEAEKLPAQESLWESYRVGPETSPHGADWQTELNRPLAG